MKTIMTLIRKPTNQSLLNRCTAGRSNSQHSAMGGQQNRSNMQRVTPGIFATLALMLVAVLVALPAFRGWAEPASDPAGFYRITCLGNSDTLVSIPFSRPAAANAIVESVTDNVVTVKGEPGWAENQFLYVAGSQPNTYYLRFLDGDKEGSYYPITGNGPDTLTISLGGDDISTVIEGNRLTVVPYWTLGTAFPEGRGVHKSGGIARRTQVLIPNYTASGVNNPPLATYYFLTNATFPDGVWQQVNEGSANKNDEILLPDLYVIVRHNIDVPTVITAQGGVPISKLATPLAAQEIGKQDNFVALARPATVTLNESGLIESGAFVPTSSLLNRRDELLVFDNNKIGKNKAPSATYYYRTDLSPNRWVRVNDSQGTYGTTDMGDQPVFLPGTGAVVRKASVLGGSSSTWVNVINY